MNFEHRAQHTQWKQWLAALAASSVMLSRTVDTVWTTRGEYLALYFQDLLSNIGCIIIGAILGVVLADIYGRKRTLLVASLFVIPRLANLNFVSANLSWINDVFMDVGSGLICTVVPLYISEIADTNIRGTLMAVQLLVFTFGALISQTFYAIFPFYDIPQWRGAVNNALLIIGTLFHVITLAILPETPHYLYWKKRYEEASKSLAYFRGVNYVKVRGDASEELVNAQWNNEEESWIKKFSDIVKFENRRSLAMIIILIACKWACGQQRNEFGLMTISGVNHSNYYIVLLGICVAKLVSTICIMFIDVGGRKLSLLIVISCSLLATIILMTPLREYYWIIFPSYSVPILGHVVFTVAELAYIGTFFPINVRAIATASVISIDVLARNVTQAIEQLGYSLLLVPCIISASVLFCLFFVVLIFFPKTNYVPCSETTVEIPVRGESTYGYI